MSIKHSGYYNEGDSIKRREKFKNCVNSWNSFIETQTHTPNKDTTENKIKQKEDSIISFDDFYKDKSLKDICKCDKKLNKNTFKKKLENTVGTEWFH